MIVNLAVNAREAMPDGGTLTIEVTTVELGESHASQAANIQPGRYAVLALTDMGLAWPRRRRRTSLSPFQH